MARGRTAGQKNLTKRICTENKGSDESDEDYAVGEDEFDETEDEYLSLDGEESELVGEFEDEGLEETGRKRVKNISRPKGSRKQSAKRRNKFVKPKTRKVLYSEEDEDDEEDDDYDVSEDDEDDDEFTLEKTDSLDDEDELAIRKRGQKAPRTRLMQKKIIRGQKRKRKPVPLKKSSMEKRKTHKPLKRRLRSHRSPELRHADAHPVILYEKKTKITSGRKHRKMIVESDSDFVSSGPSDYEYTISEEEREQVREANEICKDLGANLRSSSSLKKSHEPIGPCIPKRPATRKEKEKIEHIRVEVGKQVCGICLSEESKRTVRGTLNCCSHYFCFACIMEWSKVESRCPLCKQRFTTISKPARSNTGFDLRTVIIQIPERDQVYQPSEEELRGFLDPYENVICIECQQGGDDALMLLCDLCDSPAHTYCVGLGREVPDGNWYCEGCRPTAHISTNPEGLNPTQDDRLSYNLSVGSSPVTSVRASFDLNELYVPETPVQETGFPSPRPIVGDVQAASPTFGSGAFTVSERRRIQRQIHQLLNSRMRRHDGNIGQSVTGSSLFGSQVIRSRELAPQHAIIPDRMSSQSNIFQGGMQGNTAYETRDMGVSLGRSSLLSLQLNQNQASTSTDMLFGSRLLPNGFGGINTRINPGSHQQLHPCSNTLYMESDTTASFPFREATVPSRTLQGALRTPF